MAHGGGTRAIVAAFFANLGIAIAKFIGFLFTSSSSMLAESIHSVADTANQGLLLLGGRRAARPADEEHQFGYGRERYFWAFVVALVLFAGGSAFAVFEGIEKIRHPHELESVEWAIGILLVAIALETYSFRTAVAESNHVRHGRSWSQFVRRSKSPELPVVLLEDMGALIGLVIALGAVVTAHVTEDPVWDGVGTLLIGILLGVIAIVLASEMKSLLIGEAASEEHDAAIRRSIEASPEVTRIIHLKTQHIGPEELLVAGKVEFERDLTFDELTAAIDDLERRVRSEVGVTCRLYVEPDRYRPARTTT